MDARPRLRMASDMGRTSERLGGLPVHEDKWMRAQYEISRPRGCLVIDAAGRSVLAVQMYGPLVSDAASGTERVVWIGSSPYSGLLLCCSKFVCANHCFFIRVLIFFHLFLILSFLIRRLYAYTV